MELNTDYYAFYNQNRLICLICASKENLTGEVISIEDAYPNGFTCDDCNETIY